MSLWWATTKSRSRSFVHSSHVTNQQTKNSNHNQLHHEHDNAYTDLPSVYTLAVLTRPHQAPPPLSSIHHHVIAYTEKDLTTAFQNTEADIVVSTVASADVSLQKDIINAAIAAHVRHFIPCEFSHDTQDIDVRDRFPPARARKEVLEYLEGRQGIGWTGIATGCMLGSSLVDGLLGFDLTWKSATIYGTGDEEFPYFTLGWVGNTVANVIDDLGYEREAKRHIYRFEFVTSQNEILSILEKIDRQSWDVVRADVGECVREGKRRTEKGFLDGATVLMERAVLFGEVGNVGIWMGAGGENGVERTMRLEEVVRGVVEELGRHGRGDCGCG